MADPQTAALVQTHFEGERATLAGLLAFGVAVAVLQYRTLIRAFNPVKTFRERLQAFEGVVIARRGSSVRESFTVRKLSFGVGVERSFPLHSPIIDKIQVVTRGDVRRAKLYYLRDRVGKAAKVKEKRFN